jgi:hypothetical protein
MFADINRQLRHMLDESRLMKRLTPDIKVRSAVGDIDKALALLTRLELGDADPATHPDVVQAKAFLAKAQLKLGGKR